MYRLAVETLVGVLDNFEEVLEHVLSIIGLWAVSFGD
jgi:hypothetical protein